MFFKRLSAFLCHEFCQRMLLWNISFGSNSAGLKVASSLSLTFSWCITSVHLRKFRLILLRVKIGR